MRGAVPRANMSGEMHDTAMVEQTRREKRIDRESMMVKISVEVSSRHARFRMTLCAQSIERAVDVASACYPGSEVRVVFPIEPNTFFTNDSTLVSEELRLEVLRTGT